MVGRHGSRGEGLLMLSLQSGLRKMLVLTLTV